MLKHMLPRTIKWYKENFGGTSIIVGSWMPDVFDSERWEENYRLSRNIRRINDKLRDLKDNLEHYFKNPSKYEIKDINQFSSIDF